MWNIIEKGLGISLKFWSFESETRSNKIQYLLQKNTWKDFYVTF